MRVQFSWVIALLLAGCQLTQPHVETSSETNDAIKVSTSKVVSEPLTTKKTRHSEPTQAKLVTPQQQQDVWQRIAMQLSLPIADHPTVDYYRDWYLKHPNHLATVARRAEPFLYLITEKIEQRELPLELALLPIVESSFDAFAYSHGRAAGLWQFVPATGEMLGLEQNFWYDGRRDVFAATDAALEYLTRLNRRFDGDWYLAIAAYNSGGGRVSGAIRRNAQQGKDTDFFSLSLPRETSSYVPRLLALADIVANQEQYGIQIPAIANQPVLALVDPQEQLDLAIAADYADISLKELQSYNPGYNQWATAPDGPHQLLIPIAAVAEFQQQVEENRGQGLKLVRYQVKSGDSLSVIAQRHNTTTAIIQTANNLSGHTIRVGQYLMIPTSVTDEDEYVLSASNRLARTQSLARGQYRVQHTVSSGESLWTIARAHNVSYQALARWNGMSPRDTLRIGQQLVIWKQSNEGAIIRTVFYQVRQGDTLSAIASRFRVNTQDIIQWNELANQRYLQPGQRLKLYVDVTQVSV